MEEGQNTEQGQNLQSNENEDITVEGENVEDDLNLTETPDNRRRAARRGSSGKKTAEAVVNEFEGKDGPIQERVRGEPAVLCF